jgi:hypothetical protein
LLGLVDGFFDGVYLVLKLEDFVELAAQAYRSI